MLPAIPPTPMTSDQIYTVMVQVGFPKELATTMTAISLRESAGVPTAYNGNAQTGDDSLGLTQINLKSPQVAALMAQHGITREMLLTAEGNARGAFLLWGGNNKNLNVAWYIGRPGSYQDRYNAHLPEAQAAALRYQAA